MGNNMIRRNVWSSMLLVLFLAISGLIWFSLPELTFAQSGSDPQVLAAGAELYIENCAPCHGVNGEGRVGVTLAKDWPSIRPDLLVREVITSGVPGSPMPAWSEVNGGPLSEIEIDLLVAYILSWQTGGYVPLTPEPTITSRPPITPLPGITGDPNRGAQLYIANCDLCHGTNGEGRIGATLAKSWPSIRPDLRVKTVIENGVSGSLMSAWAAENGGPLSDEDVDDLVSFILTLPGTPASRATPTIQPDQQTRTDDWVGIAATLVIFVVIIAVIILIQRKHA